MSFAEYPEYKESAIEWAKIIPSNWKVLPLYSLAIESVNSNVGMTESNLLSLSYGRVIRKDINSNDGLLPQSFETYQIVEPNQIILRLTDLQNDMRSLRSALVTERGIITSAYLALEPKDIQPRYLSHLLRAYDITKVFYSMGGGLRQSTKFKDLKRLTIITPSKEEQVSISNFLDHETAKIDALIQEQERLIELLKEKRQAVISHAVTKGLDPTVKMKDSGVEWLGEVPEHWGVRSLKHIVASKITDGPHETPEFLDEGVPFISAEAISSGKIDFKKIRGLISQKTHQRYSQKYLPQRGDIYMVKSGATTGVCAIVETSCEFNIWSPLAAIRCSGEMNPYFLLLFLRSRNFQEAVTLNWSFGTQQNIGMGVIENLHVAIPPKHEQMAIANHLAIINDQTDKILDDTALEIMLLRERRSALISAAVTGQIDVRDFKPQAQAA
jgi:type I restriction enzyme S subunit